MAHSVCSGNDEAADSWNGLEDFERGFGQMDGPGLVGFAIRQPNESPFPIDMRPLDGRDLT